MPGMQWLGTIPERQSTGSKIADVMGSGLEGYTRGKELRSKVDMMEHTKKLDLAKLISSVISHVSDEKRSEMINDSEIQAVFASAGVPIPTTPPIEKRSMIEQWGVGEEASVGPYNPLRATPWFAYKGGGRESSPFSIGGVEDLRTQAKNILMKEGYPITEANLSEVVRQLGGK